MHTFRFERKLKKTFVSKTAKRPLGARIEPRRLGPAFSSIILAPNWLNRLLTGTFSDENLRRITDGIGGDGSGPTGAHGIPAVGGGEKRPSESGPVYLRMANVSRH